MSWPNVPLAEIAEINPRGPSAGLLQSDELVDFVPMEAVTEDGRMAPKGQRPFREVAKGYTAFQNNDVLVAKITPCFENNKITRANIRTLFAFGSTEFYVIRGHDEQLDTKYLTFFLRQDRIRHAGERRMTGSAGQRRVPKSFLQELKIPLPPLEEQKRIAAILDKADRLRRLRQCAIDKLNTLGQAIFQEMFGDPTANNRAWPTKKLSEVGSLERGVSKHRPRNDPVLIGGDHPLIQTGDVARAQDFITDYTATYSDAGLIQSKKWPRGTLCITIAANIADTSILTFDSCFPDSVVGFSSKNPAANLFIHFWFKATKGVLEKTAPSVAQKNINLAWKSQTGGAHQGSD